MTNQTKKRGRPVKAEDDRRVAIAARVNQETAKLLKASGNVGQAIDDLVRKHLRAIINDNNIGSDIMKTIINTTLILTLAVGFSACGMPGAIDRAGDKISDAASSLEDKIDEILQEQAEEGAADDEGEEYGETEAEIEEATGTVYVATYYQVADTCGNAYGFEEYYKLYSAVTDGKLGGDTFITDITGEDRTDVAIDPDSGVFSLDVTGSSALDVLECACTIDADGFTCHCEDSENDSCAVVYDVL